MSGEALEEEAHRTVHLMERSEAPELKHFYHCPVPLCTTDQRQNPCCERTSPTVKHRCFSGLAAPDRALGFLEKKKLTNFLFSFHQSEIKNSI